MEELSSRTAREVFDEHLKLADEWKLEEDLRRNVSEDCVVLINRSVFRGHEGVRELAEMLGEKLPDHRSFEYIYRGVEGLRCACEEEGSIL